MSTSRSAAGRSCFECRRRKIRCDRNLPCSYCIRTRIKCVYPQSERSRRSQSGIGARTLESEYRSENTRGEIEILVANSPDEVRDPHAKSNGGWAKDSGDIVLDGSCYRYIANSAWARLYQESNNKGRNGAKKNDADAEQVAGASEDTGSTSLSTVFPFESTISSTPPQSLHPSTTSIFFLWQTYLENVDPLLKILHVPTIQSELLRNVQALDTLSPSMESLMFAIYYAAVISMPPSDCQTKLNDEKSHLLKRFRLAIHHALSRANFLTSLNLTTLQAFVLYLICARRDDVKEETWTLVSLAIRIATKMGLHRDGETFHLPPFETEMRRRIWWQLYILDIRLAEDNGLDPSIHKGSFDTKPPSNLNDSDLDPNMSEIPPSHRGRTEMLFSLSRFEISSEARKIVFSPQFSLENKYEILTQNQKSDWIDELHQKIEQKYLAFCDTKIPFDFVICSASRIIISKLKLTLYHHLPRLRDGSQDRSSLTRESLFKTSIDVLKESHALRTHQGAKRWLWLFETYIEWDALAYVLIQLCSKASNDLYEEAWSIVEDIFSDWKQNGFDEADRRWQQIEKLRAKARKVVGQRLRPTAPPREITDDEPELVQGRSNRKEVKRGVHNTTIQETNMREDAANLLNAASDNREVDIDLDLTYDGFPSQEMPAQELAPTPISLLEQIPSENDWTQEDWEFGDFPVDMWSRLLDWEQRNSMSWL